MSRGALAWGRIQHVGIRCQEAHWPGGVLDVRGLDIKRRTVLGAYWTCGDQMSRGALAWGHIGRVGIRRQAEHWRGGVLDVWGLDVKRRTGLGAYWTRGD